MKVILVAKAGCPRCLLAEQKFKIMGVDYTKTTDLSVIPDFCVVKDKDFPVILIDGDVFNYSDAMAELKRRTQ